MPRKKPDPSKFKKKAAKKPQKNFFKYLIIGGVIIAFGILGYSALAYQNSNEEEEGFFVCNADNTVCELSQHIHADLHLKVCGKEIVFPKEKGRTDKQHTHKEKNKLHWHQSLRVDPITREPLDSKDVRLKAFFEQMDYEFPGSCPGNPKPEIKAQVNGKELANPMNYVWTDGDAISIAYE